MAASLGIDKTRYYSVSNPVIQAPKGQRGQIESLPETEAGASGSLKTWARSNNNRLRCKITPLATSSAKLAAIKADSTIHSHRGFITA
jgi:hypothetical protein